jgi:dihydroorotate dehydrogenase electron transfer subunit
MNASTAACYADQARQRTVTVLQNTRIARDTYRLRFECPEIARLITPGQFVMLRLAGYDDPLLGRALALFDTTLTATGEASCVDVVYLVGGKMTQRLMDFQPGQKLEVWGPLGNGFSVPKMDHLVMVAGGIGQTPFLALAQQCLGQREYGMAPQPVTPVSRVTFCYGVRSAEFLAAVEDFQRVGVDVRIATDDGSAGHHGLVTDLLEQVLAEVDSSCFVACCGPEAMMEQVARITREMGVPCQVSLETPMACGIGICFSCVAKVRQSDGHWDYRRTCVEGPVFDAQEIAW